MAGLSLRLLRQLSSSDLSQRDSLLRLATPLGQDALLVECVRGEEGLSHGFSFAISALSVDANLSLKSLIGQPALLQLMTAHSRDVLRPFHGHVTAVEHSGSDGGLARYRLTLEPWTRFASLGRDSRVFQHMTVFDIIDAVFREYQSKGRLAPEWRFDIVDRDVYPVRSLTTQYQESNFAFVARLMAEEGLFHFFEHTDDPGSPSLGSHTMVIADHNGAFQPNFQPQVRFTQSSAVMKEDGMDRWRIEQRLRAGAVELDSWDYRALRQRSVSTGGHGAALTDHDTRGQYAYTTREHGQRLADRHLESVTAGAELYVGAGTVRTLAPGTTFTLHGQAQLDAADDAARTFAVVRVVHLMHNNLTAALQACATACLGPGALALQLAGEQGTSLHAVGPGKGERPLYRNRIDAIRSSTPYRTGPDAHPQRPRVQGQQTAIVVGSAGSVIHTDRDHRVKVQFHWQRGEQGQSRLAHPAGDNHTGAPGDDTAGTWVRVATPLAPVAGANWGSHALPRVGQEVLVDFLEGDIDRPVVIGAVYNGRGQMDAQYNQVAGGPGGSTGNAAAWFPGESGSHAHAAVLSGIKSQAMKDSQAGAGAYSQLVLDDSPGQSRLSLQRHAAAHDGMDELNLGMLRHQTDNRRLHPTGFGAELKTANGLAMRAGRGLLLSADARGNASGTQLDAREAGSQVGASKALQESLASAAQQHNAKLDGEPAPAKLPATTELADTLATLDATDGGEHTNPATAFSQPHLQLSAPAGIVAVTPASAVMFAGATTSLTAGQDINVAAQGSWLNGFKDGITLFTYGKASAGDKPNKETGFAMHAASGKASVQSQSGMTKLAAAKRVTVASVAKSVMVAAKQHVMLTAQGAYLKLEGGNIMLHGPGKMSFKATSKELAGPADGSFNAPALPSAKPLYDEQFVLLDKHSGEPMAFVAYRIEGPEGVLARGVTDATGHTQRVHTGFKRQTLQLFLDE
ncbi:type VI secretion system Vgr family protein [Pseudoduganella buxea]|uniref:Type VI secretion system tip protein VgrG n=1 Tax=Pseudoduganella buxea TaxID=1949069 RepID=A0A6I3T0K6_9BURK|nr:type VI secretion system Vgr family protein [Pseudoduganella buxea]MTV54953.1 type VI secretion system tip protein VgrG [Pseudoduganella buxea]